MIFSNVKFPQWANDEKTAVACEVKFNHIGVSVPFAASLNDPELHGREIFARCAAGEFGPVAAYVPPPAPEPLPLVAP